MALVQLEVASDAIDQALWARPNSKDGLGPRCNLRPTCITDRVGRQSRFPCGTLQRVPVMANQPGVGDSNPSPAGIVATPGRVEGRVAVGDGRPEHRWSRGGT